MSISRSSTPDSTSSMLESQTESRPWTILSEVPTGGNQSSRLAPDSTARVALYHQTSSYAPCKHPAAFQSSTRHTESVTTASAYHTSDSYSTFHPPPSSGYSRFHPPPSSGYSTFIPPASSRYSTFVPPTSTRSSSPPLPENPFSDRKARAPLIRQTLDTISSVPSYRS